MVARRIYMRFIGELFERQPCWSTGDLYDAINNKWEGGTLPTKTAFANILSGKYKNINKNTGKLAEWIKW